MNHTTTANDPSRDVPAAGALPGVRDRADPRLVLADRVEQLYGQMWLGILATFAIGGVATFEFWNERLRDLVLFWWGLVLLISTASAVLLWSYRRSAERAAHADQWLRWLGIAALAMGANWGFAGAVFFPSHTDEQQVFLAFLLAGMMSGGIPVYAASWPIFALYAAGIVAPFTYVLATFGNRLFVELALLVPMFYVINVAIAWRLTQVFHSGYRLRHAYGRLTEDYSVLNQRLQRQLLELEEARRQVEASGRKLALFAERAPIAVFELDPSAVVTQVNHAAELLFGYAASELAGGSIKRLVRPEFHAEFDREWAKLLASRQPIAGIKVRNPRRDGIDLICEWTVTPLVNAAGGLISVIAQGRDITAQLEAERNGQRLLDLINDILDIEKIESGKLTLVSQALRMDELVREAIVLNKGFADRFKVRFEARGELPPWEVHADHKRLLQVMTNLLSNSAKFSPEGGTVEITLEDRGESLRIAVHDRGPGIPEAFRAKIFGRFTQADSTATRQKGGTGLGLAICKRLIELMHGRIGFEDRPGGGTTFWFELRRHSK